MDVCAVEGHVAKTSFGELAEAMEDDLYWVRFFARPCCPAPDLEQAAEMLDHLKSDICGCADFTAPQKAELVALIEARRKWYATSGLCRGSREHRVRSRTGD